MGESMYIPMFCNNYHELPGIGVPGTGESMYISKPSDDLLSSLLLLLVGRWPVYSSASLHLFIGRPQFLFHSGIPSRTFLTSRSSAILDMCSLHSVLLLLYPRCYVLDLTWFSYPVVSRSIPLCFICDSSQCFHFSYLQHLHSFFRFSQFCEKRLKNRERVRNAVSLC